ncbi:MAG: hypothetical protein QOE60_987 [Thermoleophilaceae bacterium]|nr:hypothetical protein [Thermoleophilaceae bacterium]
MNRRTLISLVVGAALAAGPAVAQAADPVVVPHDWADQVTALDGTIVWAEGSQLMKRSPSGVIAPVPGAPLTSYSGIDLGRNAQGRVVLTYLRCTTVTKCDPYLDDLVGNTVALTGLAPRRCVLANAPSIWGSKMAYMLRCFKLKGRPGVPDATRSGLFVRIGFGAPRRLWLPDGTSRFDPNSPPRVDLRGTIVGAVVGARNKLAITQTIDATRQRVARVATQADGQYVTGMALDGSGVLWTVTQGYVGDGEDSYATDDVISRLGAATCADSESIPSEGSTIRAAQAIAVDGATIYLTTTHSGIVSHVFMPTFTCS